MENSAQPAASEREIIITRVVDAPRELVWDAWTDPKKVVNWWGPRGFSTTIHEMDVRVGGVWSHTMRGPDGTEYPNKSVFREVVKPERIVYSHGGGKKGDQGASFLATWTFEAVGNKTKITMHSIFPTAEMREHVVKTYRAIEGGNQTLDRLEEEMLKAKAKEFTLSRVFDAPRELVWKAFTEPERMAQWWGPKGVTIIKSVMDLRPGGTYLYGMRTPDGKEMWGKMVYREIVPPKKMVFVNSFSDERAGLTRHPLSATWPLELLSTFVFEEENGKTKFTIRWIPFHANEEERKTFDGAHAGMTQGWSGTMEQLETYLGQAKA